MDGLECELEGKKVGGAIVNPAEIRTQVETNKWLAAMMMIFAKLL
jgi:hypothetical protein